jgi:hypothetical protein
LVRLACAAAFALVPAVASATMFHFTASLDASQEVPANPSTATGTATVTFDDTTNLLSWTISYSGLTGTSTDAHFHGPAAPGVNAGVRVPIPHTDGLTADTLIGSAVISNAFATELFAELWYINIHSTFRTGGEIRGQVLAVPAPASAALLALGVGGLALAGRRRVL